MKYYLFFILFVFSPLSQAAFNPFGDSGQDSKTEASLISEASAIAPGATFSIAIKLKHQEGWHAYFKNPGGPGLPLKFDWKLPAGYQLKALHWQTPHLYTSLGTQFYVYKNTYYLIADISAPANLTPGELATITVTPTWQLCDEKGCDPPSSKELSIQIPVKNNLTKDPTNEALFQSIRKKLPQSNALFDITTKVTEKEIILTLVPKTSPPTKISNLHFIPDAKVTDPDKKQTFTTNNGIYTLIAQRAEDSTVPNPLTGLLLINQHTSISVSIQTSGNTVSAASAAQPSGHAIQNQAPTPEDIQAAAALYDADSKIDYVLLDGTKEKSHNFFTALGFIFLGGFLLNLMPCVFPVLGIKVMGFAQQAGSDPRKIKLHGLVFMAGLVVSMWVLAGIIYTLIFVFGRDINWGEQLTSPIFLAAMIMLLFLFGLNMAGVFEVGTSLTGAGGELQQKKGYSGSFFSGVLTTLIATPCSGPFLGSVMGYTLKQPPLQGMVIFTVFALGISLPYVVLAFFPKLINKLPRPGAWMETFKQFMAFALFATAAYFFRSFAKITGTGGASWLLMAIVVAGLAAWAYGRFGTPYTSKGKKYVWGFAFPLLVAGGAFLLTKSAIEERAPSQAISGSTWYPGVVELNRSKKRVVWVDHTADW